MSIMQKKSSGLLSILASHRYAAWLLVGALAASHALAGGHPDPGNQALSTTNSNQLMGLMGPDRGFFSGDYVTNAIDARGLQTRIGADATYDYFIEVPAAAAGSQLVLEIFDADTGAGSIGGTELHDQDNNDGTWDTATRFELFDPDGVSVSVLTLQARDCDPVTVGNQTGCDNAWTAFPEFTVPNPVAQGHWRFSVTSIDGSSNTDPANEDDNNTYGIRASSVSGAELNVYARTYVGLGEVFDPQVPSNPGFGRTHGLYPLLARGCRCSFNNFDSDDDDDESVSISTRPVGEAGAITPNPANFDLSAGNSWFSAGTFTPTFLDGFTSETEALEYGLWEVEWFTGEFNFIVFWMGHDDPGPTVEDALPDPEPNEQPEDRSMRLYLPAAGSTFFEGNENVIAPAKPRIGQRWELLAGEPGLAVGVTSRIEVTISVDNPTAFPIQFDAATGGTNVVDAFVPTNGGQTVFVTGSPTIVGGSSTATSVSGAGPWDLSFAPGVIDAGNTALLTYQIDITPNSFDPVGINVTGVGAGEGTQGNYVDETCADGAGGSSSCSPSALATATFNFGPLCELLAPVTGSIGVAKEVSSGPVDNLDGTFTVGFSLVVANFGSEELTAVQVTDDLAATFPGPAVVTTVGAVAVNNSGGGMLTANGGFNGVGDTDLLVAGSSTLPVMGSSTISFTVTFDPNGLPGPFFNQVLASGDTMNGTVSDLSDNGDEPDPDGDGNPFEDAGSPTCPSTDIADDCENDPTPIGVPENPSISIVKTSGAVSDAPTLGQFDVVYSLLVSNDGNVDLAGLQVVDNLALTFPAPATVISSSVLCTLGSCGTITIDYAGPADTMLLNPVTSSLTVNASFTLELTVRFDPNGLPGPFNNLATASGLSPQATSVQDSDTDQIAVVENPSISLAKTAGLVVPAPMNGQFDVVFTLLVSNTGNVDLEEVQVFDDLTANFPGTVNLISSSALCTAGSCGSIVLEYGGPVDTTLLDAPNSSLPAGETFTLELSARFQPNGTPGPYTNLAATEGTSPLGADVTDSDSVDIDPPLGGVPVIGVAKTVVGDVVENGDETFTVSMLISVDNLGDLDLQNVQVVDDLFLTFPAPSSVVTVTAPSATVTMGVGNLDANAAYNGVGDTNLLIAGSSTLDVGAAGEITFDITFDPADLVTFDNSAIATADSVAGPTTDISDDGTNVDPNGDGDPTGTGENDPTPIDLVVGMAIPSLDQWGLALLIALLAACGSLFLRRQGS